MKKLILFLALLSQVNLSKCADESEEAPRVVIENICRNYEGSEYHELRVTLRGQHIGTIQRRDPSETITTEIGFDEHDKEYAWVRQTVVEEGKKIAYSTRFNVDPEWISHSTNRWEASD